MPITVKLDESLSPLVGEPLVAAGHAVRTVREQGLGGFKDPEVWKYVQAEGVYFITTDKEFADVRRFPPGTHAGVMLLRPDRESLVEYRNLIAQVLKMTGMEMLQRTITVVSPGRIRVRR